MNKSAVFDKLARLSSDNSPDSVCFQCIQREKTIITLENKLKSLNNEYKNKIKTVDEEKNHIHNKMIRINNECKHLEIANEKLSKRLKALLLILDRVHVKSIDHNSDDDNSQLLEKRIHEATKTLLEIEATPEDELPPTKQETVIDFDDLTPTQQMPSPPSKKRKKSNKNNDYKLIETVRNKDEREALEGFDCSQCGDWYNFIQKHIPAQKYASSPVKMCNHCSRHRFQRAPPTTPDGYWDTSLHTPPTPPTPPRSNRLFRKQQQKL